LAPKAAQAAEGEVMAIITKLAFALLVAFLIASVVDAAQATLAPLRAAAEAHGAATGKIGPAGRPHALFWRNPALKPAQAA
jgi:hypothetical protein